MHAAHVDRCAHTTREASESIRVRIYARILSGRLLVPSACLYLTCTRRVIVSLFAHLPGAHLCRNMSSIPNTIFFYPPPQTDGGNRRWARERREDELRGYFNGGVGK